MKNMASVLGSKRVRDLAIPGTHDSGTFAITTSSKLAKDLDDYAWLAWARQNYISNLILPNIMTGWATTQGFNFGQQLDAGIRYFDFRVQRNGPCDFKIIHGLESIRVEDALKQFNSWLNAEDSYTGALFNDQEILFLDFWKFRDMTIDGHHDLCNLLMSTFNNKFILYNGTSSRDITVDTVWKDPKKPQIICFYAWQEIENDANYNKYMWPRVDASTSALSARYYETNDFTELFWKLDQGIARISTSNKFYCSQTIKTGKPQDWGLGFATFGMYPDSVFDFCQDVNKELVTRLKNQWKGKVRIVTCDWFNIENDFVDAVVKSNL